MEWEKDFREWLKKEDYTSLINHHGINELIRHIEIDILLPVQAELSIKTSVLKKIGELIEGLK